MFQKIISNKKYLLGIVLIVYLPTLFFQYVYLDDYLMVQEPGFHNNLSNIPASFFRAIWPYNAVSYQYYRPVSISLYILGTWITQQISGETLPWIYHLTNWFLQASVVSLVFSLFLRLGIALPVAGAATLLFAVHPALTGAVCWIPGQNELLLAILVLSSFIALLKYLKTKETKWLLFHGFLFTLSLMTKENALVLPILCGIYLLSTGRPLKVLGKYITTWIGFGALWFIMLKWGASQNNPVTGGVIANILSSTPYTLVYLGKLFLPFPLSTLPTFADSSLITLVAGVLGLFSMLVALYYSKNRWFSLFGIAWYFGFLMPTFAMVNGQSSQNFILREDRGYLAALGLWILFIQIPWNKISEKIKTASITTLVCLFIILNLFHQQNYSTGKSFYSNAVAGAPRLAFAHLHLSDMYLTEKNFDTAIQGYKKALELNPFEYQAHNNLGVAYLRTGNIDMAVEEFKLELRNNSKNVLSLFNLASILLKQGQIHPAESLFRRAVTINPAYTEAWLGLVTIYTHLKDDVKLEEAKRALKYTESDMSKGL